jgi:hypothetical protein
LWAGVDIGWNFLFLSGTNLLACIPIILGFAVLL